MDSATHLYSASLFLSSSDIFVLVPVVQLELFAASHFDTLLMIPALTLGSLKCGDEAATSFFASSPSVTVKVTGRASPEKFAGRILLRMPTPS
jgi:hypothetical protein